MRLIAVIVLMAAFCQKAGATVLDIRVMSGPFQLGGDITLRIRTPEGPLPGDAVCSVEVPEPYDGHYTVVSSACEKFEIDQSLSPILDGNGMALPSAQFPYEIVAASADGAELGRAEGMMLYANQFSDIRVLIKGIRNPVAEGSRFDVQVLGAGQPIATSLTCRWNAYGPVQFDPTSPNGCEGTITALAPSGADGDLDVEIVNMTDMHAVGYGVAKILVQ